MTKKLTARLCCSGHALYLVGLVALSGCSATPTNATADSGNDGAPPPSDGRAADQGDLASDGPLFDGALADAAGPYQCAAPRAVNSKAELQQVLATLTWEMVGSYTTRTLAVSDDVALSRELLLESADVAVPATCTARQDCQHSVSFVINTNAAGAQCTKRQAGEVPSDRCVGLRLAPGRYRFRATLQDIHPSAYNFTPMLTVLPSCEAPCAAFSCAANKTCWSTFGAYCRLCLNKPLQTCACLEAQGPLPNETDCYFPASGDVMCQGKCRSGFCEYTGEPNWAGCP